MDEKTKKSSPFHALLSAFERDTVVVYVPRAMPYVPSSAGAQTHAVNGRFRGYDPDNNLFQLAQDVREGPFSGQEIVWSICLDDVLQVGSFNKITVARVSPLALQPR